MQQRLANIRELLDAACEDDGYQPFTLAQRAIFQAVQEEAAALGIEAGRDEELEHGAWLLEALAALCVDARQGMHCALTVRELAGPALEQFQRVKKIPGTRPGQRFTPDVMHSLRN